MRKRIRTALRTVPRPLAILLAVVALFGFAWALITPAFGNPDEDVHFAYTQTLVEKHALPGKGHYPTSSEQSLAANDTNTSVFQFFTFAKPEWSHSEYSLWLKDHSFAPRNDGGGQNAASAYPPAYYLYEAVPYALTRSNDIFTRIYTMRFFSLAWLLLSTLGAWLLAGEIFGRDRVLQLLTAGTFGLWPMLSFISAAINPDAMLDALWTLSAWLGVAIVKRGPSAARVVGLCACVGLALVTKLTALGMVPPAAFALAVGSYRLRRVVSWRHVAWAAGGIAAIGVPVAAWVMASHAAGSAAYGQTQGALTATGSHDPGISGFLSYLWQFYLPRLPWQHRIDFLFPIISSYPVYETWIASGWAVFGWVNIWFPSIVYAGFLGITIVVIGGALVTGWRAARRMPLRRLRESGSTPLVAAFFAVMVLTLVLGLHWADFRMYAQGKPPFLQGRYLLPIGAIFGLVVAQAARALPSGARPVAVGAVLSGLVVFQLASLLLITMQFYA